MAIVFRDEGGSVAAARGLTPPFPGAVLHIMPDAEVVWSDVPAGKCPCCGFDWEDPHDCPADQMDDDDQPTKGENTK